MIMVSWVTLIRRRNHATPKTGLNLPSSRFEIKIKMEEHTHVVKFLLKSSAKESQKPSIKNTNCFPLVLSAEKQFLGGARKHERQAKQTRTGCVDLAQRRVPVSFGIWNLAVVLYTRSPQRLPKYSSIASHSRNGVSLWHYSRLNFHMTKSVCMLTNVDLYLDQTLPVLLQSLTSSIRIQLWFHS